MTQEDSGSTKMESRVQIMRGINSEEHLLQTLGDEEERKIVAKFMNSRWREKSLREYQVPVLKPTQVDDERIIRWTG